MSKVDTQDLADDLQGAKVTPPSSAPRSPESTLLRGTPLLRTRRATPLDLQPLPWTHGLHQAPAPWRHKVMWRPSRSARHRETERQDRRASTHQPGIFKSVGIEFHHRGRVENSWERELFCGAPCQMECSFPEGDISCTAWQRGCNASEQAFEGHTALVT